MSIIYRLESQDVKYDYIGSASFHDLYGETIELIIVVGKRELIFKTKYQTFLMTHTQDCCEDVQLEDVAGNWADLLGHPIVSTAEETTSLPVDNQSDYFSQSSFTWTYYSLQTCKGKVHLRWYGTSNGCYSEKVNISNIQLIDSF